jgi:hypothetical protein
MPTFQHRTCASRRAASRRFHPESPRCAHIPRCDDFVVNGLSGRWGEERRAHRTRTDARARCGQEVRRSPAAGQDGFSAGTPEDAGTPEECTTPFVSSFLQRDGQKVQRLATTKPKLEEPQRPGGWMRRRRASQQGRREAAVQRGRGPMWVVSEAAAVRNGRSKPHIPLASSVPDSSVRVRCIRAALRQRPRRVSGWPGGAAGD